MLYFRLIRLGFTWVHFFCNIVLHVNIVYGIMSGLCAPWCCCLNKMLCVIRHTDLFIVHYMTNIRWFCFWNYQIRTVQVLTRSLKFEEFHISQLCKICSVVCWYLKCIWVMLGVVNHCVLLPQHDMGNCFQAVLHISNYKYLCLWV